MDDSTLTFERNKNLLNSTSALGIVAEAPRNPALALRLAEDKPFPRGTTELGKVTLSGKAGKDVVFGGGKGKVSFKADGGAFAGLGVYTNGSDLLDVLKLDENLSIGVTLPTVPKSHYVMLRWGYGAGASAKGSVALGAGLAPTFEADVAREGVFAIIRLLPKSTGSRTSIGETVNSWILPKQVQSIDQLEPGTWVVAEVDGSIGLKLGAQYGYDFNWVREAKLGGLSGEIGLRIQLGVSVALGFHASGKYAVILSRDSLDPASKRLRLRLFKLSKKGWSFALNAGATVQADTTKILPEKFDQFIAAVFGLDPAQLMDDLKTLEKWTNPDEDLADLLAGAGTDYSRGLLEEVTGLDLETAFNEARSRVLELLDRWDKLDHEVATKLWSLAGDHDALERVRKLAEEIVAADQTSLKGTLSEELSDINFFRTAEGQWLEATLADGVLSAVTSSAVFKKLQTNAKKTLAILDDGYLEKTLGKLHDYVSERLRIDVLERVDDDAAFNELDEWLKAKLAAFLGSKLDLDKLREIRETVHLMLQKRDQFYSKAIEALNRSYQFSFAYSYQKNTARTALLDVAFDFQQNDVAAPLQQAVNGNLEMLLIEEVAGVKLNLATLTHEVTRQAKVSVDLPFFKKNVTTLNTALASVDVVEDEGRLLLYNLKAEDLVDEAVNAKLKRNSRLTVGGNLPVDLNKVKVRTTEGLTYSYSFRQSIRNMPRRAFEYQMGPYVQTYFPTHFPKNASFSAWVSNVDRAIDAVEPNGADNFGNTLISLDLSLPARVAAAWLEAPAGKNDEAYRIMSINLQEALKRTLVFYYFRDPKNFKNLVAARTLLAYAAIPPSTEVKVGRDSLTLNAGNDIYWDWPHRATRRAMLNNTITVGNLASNLTLIHQRLEAEPEISRNKLAFYRPSDATYEDIVGEADGTGDPLLRSLLFVEADMVRTAFKAGRAMAKFRRQATVKPTKAIAALADYGAKVTGAFNKKLRGVYGGGALRPLGTQLFVIAAQALDPAVRDVQPAAMAELTVLKQNADPFPPEGFPNNAPPNEDDVVIGQRLVSMG